MQPIEVENLFNQILQNMFTYDYGEYQSIPIVCVFSRHISGYVLHIYGPELVLVYFGFRGAYRDALEVTLYCYSKFMLG